MSKFSRNRSCSLEGLETRQMMAGDMVAYTYGGDLYIHESPGREGQDNHVQVSMPNATTLRVTGSAVADGTSSRIGDGTNGNFATFKNFNLNSFKNIYITTGNGNDRVAVNPGTQLTRGNLSIDTGVNGASTRDVDNVFFNQVFVQNGLTVRTGAGADRVDLGNLVVYGNTDINTGAGADTVLSYAGTTLYGGSNQICTYYSALEQDNDTVKLEDTNGYGVSVHTGEGADFVYARNYNGYGPGGGKLNSLSINTGGGADTVTLEKVVVDNIYASLGAGNDTMTVSGVKTKSGVNLDGGGDYDVLIRPSLGNITENIFATWTSIEEFRGKTNPRI